MSPPAVTREKPQFHLHFAELLLPCIRHSLQAAFEQLAPVLVSQYLLPVTFNGGSAAEIIDQFQSDTTFRVVRGSTALSPNQAPGDLKVSWKWQSPIW
jgi:hypothetical protein